MMKRETLQGYRRVVGKMGYHPSAERERNLIDSHLEAMDLIVADMTHIGELQDEVLELTERLEQPEPVRYPLLSPEQLTGLIAAAVDAKRSKDAYMDFVGTTVERGDGIPLEDDRPHLKKLMDENAAAHRRLYDHIDTLPTA